MSVSLNKWLPLRSTSRRTGWGGQWVWDRQQTHWEHAASANGLWRGRRQGGLRFSKVHEKGRRSLVVQGPFGYS